MTLKILLIEDDPVIVRLNKVVLEQEYEVLSASDGFQGLRLAREEVPDLILLDLMLPGMDGYEVLSRLRADPQTASIRVVIVSAKPRETDQQTAVKMGADSYLTKPFLPKDLLELIPTLFEETLKPTESGGLAACIAMVTPHRRDGSSVVLHIGQTLAATQQQTAVIDFRPFSSEYDRILDLPKSQPTTTLPTGALTEHVTRHENGLDLLYNLEGSGSAGQIIPQDADHVLDQLTAAYNYVLADIPLYPADTFRQVAEHCEMVVLVMDSDSASLKQARKTHDLIKNMGIDGERIRLLLVGSLPEKDQRRLSQHVLGVLPKDTIADDTVFAEVATRLIQQTKHLNNGGAP